MRRSHDGLVQVRKQHRQAVSHHDRAGQAALPRQACVGRQTINAAMTQFQHLGAVHLLQKDRLTTDGTLQNQSIGGDGSDRITDVAT